MYPNSPFTCDGVFDITLKIPNNWRQWTLQECAYQVQYHVPTVLDVLLLVLTTHIWTVICGLAELTKIILQLVQTLTQ